MLCGHCILENGLRRSLREAGVIKPDWTRVPAGIGSLASIPLFHFGETILESAAGYIGMHELAGICFFNHQRCGMYAAKGHRFPTDYLSDEEREFHMNELKLAERRFREFLDSRGFPHITLHGGFIWIDPADVLHIDWLVPPPNNNQLSFPNSGDTRLRLIAS